MLSLRTRPFRSRRCHLQRIQRDPPSLPPFGPRGGERAGVRVKAGAARRRESTGQQEHVLVEAGPEQAAIWRKRNLSSFWKGTLPNLMFLADRSWLVSTLWDDD